TYYPFADNIDTALKSNALSMYNFATYTHNEFPAYMMSLAEMDLLLAEAVLKGYLNTGKSAGGHVEDAVIHSTDFWYDIHSLSGWQTSVDAIHPPRPSESVTVAYAEKVKANFDSQSDLEEKMEVLMQQKYIHLNIMGVKELFAELRRTRHPRLEPMTFQGKVMKPTPERIRYPATALTTNPENYIKVRGQDNFTSHIFWVPEGKRNESYYKDDYSY
ncbi:MAG TPA: SusD/RagB family nutrient-binding outer membrane lipoprotein, partial [Anseongella sp.]|nr:SusD/RagB family nutrient-binding outer membrane lipoprotein [Anseongella sp.]